MTSQDTKRTGKPAFFGTQPSEIAMLCLAAVLLALVPAAGGGKRDAVLQEANRAGDADSHPAGAGGSKECGKSGVPARNANPCAAGGLQHQAARVPARAGTVDPATFVWPTAVIFRSSFPSGDNGDGGREAARSGWRAVAPTR